MASLFRHILIAASLAALLVVAGAAPAAAASHHHKHHSKTHHTTTGKTVIRIAQAHLKNLGYYGGKIDGVMGPQTRLAIKHFQKDHSLTADGVLGPKTNHLLETSDHQIIGTTSFKTMDVVSHSVVTSVDPTTVNPNYTNGLKTNGQTVSSRFGRVDVSETGSGPDKRYNINLNGQPVLTVEGQPSVIGVSQTFDLGSEDAIVFTTFSPQDTGCTYKNHVLAMSNAGIKMLDLDNCTREFQAHVANGSLFVTFPEHDDNRAIGSTWRIEGMNVDRL